MKYNWGLAVVKKSMVIPPVPFLTIFHYDVSQHFYFGCLNAWLKIIFLSIFPDFYSNLGTSC
jgi:hypothetical protein